MRDLVPIIVALITQVGMLSVTYLKLSKHIDKRTDEQKNFTDASVQKLNGMLTSVIHSFATPAWIKVAEERNGEVVFRMLELNDAYTEAYGIKRSEYIGKTDIEVGWSKDIAEKFRQHDLLVWASNEPKDVVEIVEGKKVMFRKFCVQSPSGKKKGVFGYLVPTEVK